MMTGDTIWGAAAIAKVIGKSRRATYWMLEQRMLPARKIGGQWAMSYRSWLEFLNLVNDSAERECDTDTTRGELPQ